jgi:uncharacterized protein YkwD
VTIHGSIKNKAVFAAIIIVGFLLSGIVYGIISYIQSNDTQSFGSPILNKSSYTVLKSKKNIDLPHTIALKSETVESSQISAGEIDLLLTESLNDLAQKNKEIQDSKKNTETQKDTSGPEQEQASSPVQESKVQNQNYLEARLLQLINAIRIKNSLPVLNTDLALTNIARMRNTDMFNRNYFAHHTPDGKTVFNILRENGVAFGYGGENLYKCSPSSLGPPEAVMHAWLSIEVHRANIYSPHYRKLGISVMDRGDTRIVTVIFTD